MTPDRNAASPPGIPKGVRVLGIGTDIVHIPDLAQQIGTVGSRFAEPGVVFTARELRRAESRATQKGDRLADHLAAVWAIKEAALKAWVAALEARGTPLPLPVDGVVWPEIVVSHTPSGVPSVHFTGTMAHTFTTTVRVSDPRWHVSASHDGNYALAFAVLGYAE